SRRRHTRSKRDWSSDVCSSDLKQIAPSICLMFAVFCIGLVCVSEFMSCYKSGTSEATRRRIDLPPFFAHGIIRHFLHSGLRLRRSEERRVGKECGLRRWVAGVG